MKAIWLIAAASATAAVLAISCGGKAKEVSRPIETPTGVSQPAPTAVPASPTPPLLPTTPVPTIEPEPVAQVPAPLPDRANCNEIRGTDYRSETEHQWFLANCLTAAPTPLPAAVGPAPAPAPPQQQPGPAQTSDEVRAYKSRASATVSYYVSRMAQFWMTPSYGALNDLYELGSICLNFANALESIQPVPAQFQAAHNGLVSSLMTFRNHVLAVQNVRNVTEFYQWASRLQSLASQVDASLAVYIRVTGIQVPRLGGLQ